MRAGLRSEGKRLNVRLLLLHLLSFFMNVNHFFIKVKYVCVCVLHHLLTLLAKARHAGKGTFKAPLNI